MAVDRAGNAAEPQLRNICPDVPVANVCSAPVAVVPAARRPYAVVWVATHVPHCATVTAALSVSITAEAFGSVNVFSEVKGPVNLVNPFPVPPYADVMIVPFHVPVVITPVFAVTTKPLKLVTHVSAHKVTVIFGVVVEVAIDADTH